MKLKVDLWLDYSYFVFGMGQYTLFPIDFNGKPEIFLKHLKKKFFLKDMCVCDWTLIIFQDSLTLHYLMSTLFFLKKKKKIVFFLCTSTQITLKFFHVNHVSHVSAMLNFKIFFLVMPCVDTQL